MKAQKLSDESLGRSGEQIQIEKKGKEIERRNAYRRVSMIE